ncbi:MAG: hypothetical protein PHT84_06555 [Candidatus Pacebacteria bacterium]|nr:hypothetical protein [Candidatus Paceibacterota bacterium]
MNDFENLFPKDLYHSYVVFGEPETTTYSLKSFLEERGEIKLNSPDVFIKTYDSFTIDDGRQIKEWHSELKISEGKKICLIGAKFINHDAERTLLKIIEEPASNTHFFLIVPNHISLLDTILSRTHLVNTFENNKNFREQAKDFINLDKNKRIEFVGKIIKENKDEIGSGNIRFVAISLINEIEKIIFDRFKKNYKDKNNQKLLEDLEKNREFLKLPGSSPKMILEYLALVL